MNNYLEAYRERLQRNQAALINLINEVAKADPTVEAYVHKDTGAHLKNVTFFKDDKINSIWFHEVPYRWSGCGYGEHHRSHSGGENSSMPFTVEDVLTAFQPIEITNFIKTPTKDAYLKWYTYLTKYTTHDKNEND